MAIQPSFPTACGGSVTLRGGNTGGNLIIRPGNATAATNGGIVYYQDPPKLNPELWTTNLDLPDEFSYYSEMLFKCSICRARAHLSVSVLKSSHFVLYKYKDGQSDHYDITSFCDQHYEPENMKFVTRCDEYRILTRQELIKLIQPSISKMMAKPFKICLAIDMTNEELVDLYNQSMVEEIIEE